ncbi:collagen alpha-1(XIV) chain-like [Haliotis rubra]|uniref:collagen alpha-1(XIV) chain-like n=1 Tax=Haliotis rubra TaxID=36100 RepID=UPI001EE53BB7|nr:collagen alpha-1(XIV) chain-like [Haliotis rubra]
MIPLLAASVILSSMIGRTLMAGAATDCGSHKRDVLFMVDNTSMNRSEFAILKQALVDIVDTFTISPDNIQVTVTTYPDVVMLLWLSFQTDKSRLKDRILNLDPNSKNQPLSPTKAIDVGRYNAFGGGDRADASNVALLFAGSKLYLTEEDVSKSDHLKENKKVELFCLGVKNAYVSQLNQFASLPSSDHVFFSDTYSNLATLVPELAQIACANCSMTPCQGSQICDLSTNTCIDQTPLVTAPRKECPMNLYERQSYRISGCPIVMTTFAESPIVCAVHCCSTEGCTNFNMAREADILNNCQLLTCTDTDMLSESEHHDFYTPTCVP